MCKHTSGQYRHTYISINLDIDECSNETDGCSQISTNAKEASLVDVIVGFH